MGGRDKAELRAPGSEKSLLQRWVELGRSLELEVVVVGGRPREGLVTLSDAPAGVGPLGGLGPLLGYAAARPALVVACDMPYVTRELLALLAARKSRSAVLAPRDPESGKWQPLFARYDSQRVAPVLAQSLAAAERSFQWLFARLAVEELALTSADRHLLRDWDRPGDVPAPDASDAR
jgi:molybdopterin-guanine dinucleotide biosynthesis protein A